MTPGERLLRHLRWGDPANKVLADNTKHTLDRGSETNHTGPTRPAGRSGPGAVRLFNAQHCRRRRRRRRCRASSTTMLTEPLADDGILAARRRRCCCKGVPIDRAMVGESARWASPRTPMQAYARDPRLPAVEQRKDVRYQHRARTVSEPGLVPQHQPAHLTINGVGQYGGTIRLGETLTLYTAAGAIYYTLDGSDPRLIGGSVRTGRPDVSERDRLGSECTGQGPGVRRRRVERDVRRRLLPRSGAVHPHHRADVQSGGSSADEIAAGFIDGDSSSSSKSRTWATQPRFRWAECGWPTASISPSPT